MFDEEALKEKVAGICEKKNVMLEHLYHKPLLKPEEIFEELMSYKKMLEPYVCDVSLFLWNALKEGKEILLEGQLGSLKDPDHGIYPMVTSSSTLAASSVQQPEDRDVWDGSMQWLPNTDAVCRELPM